MKKIIGALIFFLANFANAHAVDNSDIIAVETYVQYYSAVIAAELCEEKPFADEVEKAKFEKNFVFTRAYAGISLKKNKPELSDEQIHENLDIMDKMMKDALNSKHKENGCSDEVLTDAIKWHENFAKLPPFPGSE